MYFLVVVVLCLLWGCVEQDPQSAVSQTAESDTQSTTNAADTEAPNHQDELSTQDGDLLNARFVAHEWGTFTSVQDSTGLAMDGLHHVEEFLPSFVHMRDITAPEVKGMELLPSEVNQKLETPVIYFYSDRARDVHVKVDFPTGVISEWYPQATAFAPAIGTLYETGLLNGAMTWDVSVSADIDMGLSPAVEADSVWAPSRRTAATPLKVAAGTINNPSAPDEVERFIFYRGLGRFDGPLSVRSTSQGLLEVRNHGAEQIADVFLLHVHDGGGAVVRLGDVDAGGVLVAEPSPKELDMDLYVAKASAEMEQALIRSGLYADEAKAMVDTWSHSYFRTPGLRVLYIAPRAWTDALLPLTISPAPDELVRTLVGRVEVLTPPAEFEVAAWVSQVQSGQLTREDLFTRLGRFAEPKLRRASALITDPDAKILCEALVQEARMVR